MSRHASMEAVVWAAAVFWIGLGGCGQYLQPEAFDDQKIKTVVTEVLEDSSAPGSKDYNLNAMENHEDSLMNDFGEKSELKARAVHQLADLYLTLEKRMYRQQLLRYNQQVRLVQQGRAVKSPVIPQIDHSRSRKIYERLLSLYPDRPENDRVLYQLAHIDDDLGQPEEALAALQQLADRYPSSPLRNEVIFRLAEAYYDSNQYRKAQAAYQKVVDAKDAELAEQALYKLGWTAFLVQDYESAIATFTRLVDRKRVARENGPPRLDPKALSAADWDQVLEVIRSLALAFSHLGPPTAIQAYFEKAGHRDYEVLIYRKQGDLLAAQKRIQEAVGVYTAFIEAYPMHKDAPMVQMEIIEAYQRSNLVDPANRARIKFVERFGEDSLWYRKVEADSREKVRPLYRQLISQLALFYHSEAQQTHNPRDYETALAWYRRYLKAFPKESDTAHINFLLAEGLYELRRYPEAADEYERTAYNYPLHQDSAESGYAAVVTLEKIMTQGRQDPKTSPLAARLAQNCRRFGEAFPGDPRATNVLWKGAETDYRTGKFQEARLMAEMIVKAALPTDDASVKAQRLIANSFFEERLYEQAASAYQRLARTGGKTAEDEELRRLWASSLYKQGEMFKAAGKLREAQTEFMKVHAELPGNEVAPVALFDAGSVALLRNQRDEALQLFQIQLQRYPDHALSRKIPEVLLQVERTLLADGKVAEARTFTEKIKTLQTASNAELTYRAQRLLADRYFEQQAYEQAADAYRILAQDKVAAQNQEREELLRLWSSSLYKHAEGLKAAGKQKEAQAAFLKVHAEAPTSEAAPVALYEAGGVAQLRGDESGALQAFATLLRDYPASTYGVHAAIQSAQIHERQHQWRDAAREYESVVNLNPDRKTGGAALSAAARLYEQLGEWGKAEAIDKTYLAQYPGEYDEVVETTFKMAWAQLQQGRREEALSVLQTLIDRYGQGDLAATPSRYYVAKAHLLEADERGIQFDEVKLVSPLEKNLAIKKDLLNEILEHYARAAEFNLTEITTAATQKIGAVFEKFRTALLESERPQDLTPQQLEQYNFLLEEQAYPFEEKAIAAYESNVRRAQQLGLYDPWIKQSYEDLARLVPARYRKRELEEALHLELALKP